MKLIGELVNPLLLLYEFVHCLKLCLKQMDRVPARKYRDTKGIELISVIDLRSDDSNYTINFF